MNFHREVDDGAVVERRSDDAVKNLFRVFVDDRHHLVDDDHFRRAQNDSSEAQQLHTSTTNENDDRFTVPIFFLSGKRTFIHCLAGIPNLPSFPRRHGETYQFDVNGNVNIN